MDLLYNYWIPWSVSNIIAILILCTTIKKPRLARLLLALLFAWACWINYTTSHDDPKAYLEYAAMTPIGPYREFIIGWFAEHVTTMVSMIAIGQGLIAIGLLLSKVYVKIACVGGIFFLMAITPLGIVSGFPVPIILIIAFYLISKNSDSDFIWKKIK